jgi:hypothetical protein
MNDAKNILVNGFMSLRLYTEKWTRFEHSGR